MENRFINPQNEPVDFLVDAQIPIINEMFSIGGEEGFNQIWFDEQHTLIQAIRILLKARVQIQFGCFESEGEQGRTTAPDIRSILS